VTMLLTGAMSKMGVYGLLRLALPIFGHELAQVRTPLLVLATLTVVAGAWAAAVQKDLKRSLRILPSIISATACWPSLRSLACGNPDAAITLSQTAALDGVVLQMFNHGLTAAAIFWFLAMLEERSGGLLRDRRLRRPAQARAGLLRTDGHRAVFVARPAWP
jgi:NADH-quinone oxidoreductase subunit M